MTERPGRDVERSGDRFRLGPSALTRTATGLVVDIDERRAPLPLRQRGQVRVTMPWTNQRAFDLDPDGRHRWRPICTAAEVEVAFDRPGRVWKGRGYVDSNFGDEPLEAGFDYWDWSRTALPDGATHVRYVSDLSGARGTRGMSLRFDGAGSLSVLEPEPAVSLSPTPIWRIPRRSGRLGGADPRLVRTLEDTPFYSRSLLAHGPDGGAHTVHESFSGTRLRSDLVKALLPVRMPRRGA